MIQAMANVHRFQFYETLTGFKWLGNKAQDVIAEGKTFLFGFEEAIGFMIGDVCFDKDGVRAAAVFAELIHHVYNTLGMTLQQYLDQLYATYGQQIYLNILY